MLSHGSPAEVDPLPPHTGLVACIPGLLCWLPSRLLESRSGSYGSRLEDELWQDLPPTHAAPASIPAEPVLLTVATCRAKSRALTQKQQCALGQGFTGVCLQGVLAYNVWRRLVGSSWTR